MRVGNGAWNQRQLDVYGELLDAATVLPEQLDAVAPGRRPFLADLADAAADRWREPDQGIWEIRGEPRHFLYSKLMCWVALDRAIALADRLGRARPGRRVEPSRGRDRAAILDRGLERPRVGAFTQSFGSDDLDASTLMMPIVGFLPADDPRMRATVDAIADAAHRRTRPRVPLPRPTTDSRATRARFLLCTFWLAQALASPGDASRGPAPVRARRSRT